MGKTILVCLGVLIYLPNKKSLSPLFALDVIAEERVSMDKNRELQLSIFSLVK